MTDELARRRVNDLLRGWAQPNRRKRRWEPIDALRQWRGFGPADDLHPDDVAEHYGKDGGDDAA